MIGCLSWKILKIRPIAKLLKKQPPNLGWNFAWHHLVEHHQSQLSSPPRPMGRSQWQSLITYKDKCHSSFIQLQVKTWCLQRSYHFPAAENQAIKNFNQFSCTKSQENKIGLPNGNDVALNVDCLLPPHRKQQTFCIWQYMLKPSIFSSFP